LLAAEYLRAPHPDRNRTPKRKDTTIPLIAAAASHRRFSHRRTCRELPLKRFELVIFTGQFGVVSKSFLIKFQLPTSPSVLA
jgi:hypothetical protein